MDDLRVPTGLLFALLGAILCIVSFVMPEARAPLTDVDVNLRAGITMFVFGVILLLLARRAAGLSKG